MMLPGYILKVEAKIFPDIVYGVCAQRGVRDDSKVFALCS